MGGHIKKEVLGQILTKQRSPPFAKILGRCEGLAKTNRQKTRKLGAPESSLLQTRKISISVNGIRVGTEIEVVGAGPEADAAIAEIAERCREEYLELFDSVQALSKNDQFCIWLEDTEMHLQAVTDASSGLVPLLRFTVDQGRSREFIESTADRWMEFSREAAAAQRITGHALIACGALSVQKPEYIISAVESDLFSIAMDSESLVRYGQQEWLLRRVPDEEVVLELLKMLYPNAWKGKFEECTGKRIAAPKPKKKKLSRGYKLIASRLRMEFPDEEFGEEDIQEIGGACGWKEEKAAEVARFMIDGIGVEDAVFLAGKEPSEEVVQKHILLSPALELEGIAHEDVHGALKALAPGQVEAFGSSLDAYSGWKRLMPGSWGEEDRQKMSAVLALSAEPPQQRKEVLGALEGADDAIIEEILKVEENFEGLSGLFEDYTEYSKGFVKNGEKEGAEGEGEVPEKSRMQRPHESLVLPPEVEGYIESKGILVENVKRALIYGLRLSSRKSAIGGKYMPITAFRRNTRVVLSKEAGNPETRLKVVEDFLYKEGIISYYKEGDVVKLNLKDEIGQHNEPSKIGQQILDSVIGWKVEFDRKTKGGNGS